MGLRLQLGCVYRPDPIVNKIVAFRPDRTVASACQIMAALSIEWSLRAASYRDDRLSLNEVTQSLGNVAELA